MKRDTSGSFAQFVQPGRLAKPLGQTSERFNGVKDGPPNSQEAHRRPGSKDGRHHPAPSRQPRPSGMGEAAVDRIASYRKLYAPERNEARQKDEARFAKAMKSVARRQTHAASHRLKSKFRQADNGRDT